MIAINAQPILDARMQGFRPAEMILVSLVGRISEPNHTVLATPSVAYDWRWARDLDVCVYLDEAVNWRPAVLAIAKAKPQFLALWDVPSKRGATVYLRPSHPAHIEKPVRLWDWVLDFSSWLDCENKAFNQ